MTIELGAKYLRVNGEVMRQDHTREAIAKHLKAMLFGFDNEE